MMMPSGVWSVVTAVVLGILLLAKLLTSIKYKNIPPGPRGLPIIGSLHLLSKTPQRDFAKLAETYGPLMSIWLGPRLAVVATSPAAAEEFLKTQGSNFANRVPSSISDVVLPGDVVMLSETPVTLHLKKIMHIQLSTKKQIQLSTNDAFTGSISTTSDTIEWAIAECIRNPIVMKKVQAELDTVVGKSRRVEDADIPNLKYLQAVIKENFRLHPVVPILVAHLSNKPCQVLGYNIPQSTVVFVNVAAISRDSTMWEDPMAFKPERFLDGMPHAHMQVEGKNFEVLPFGAGRRQCPGIMLASTLVHIMVATFMQSFDWSLPNGLSPMDLDMSEGEGVAHMLAHPLTAIPKARLSIP